jgi:hypothetical protein
MLKRGWLVATVVGTLLVGASVGAVGATYRQNIEVDYSGIKIKLDGKIVDTGNSQPFVVVSEGRTYVPARQLAEALNAKVDWDPYAKSVLVYTANYYEAKTEGNLTTYSFPYFGARMVLPSGGEVQPGRSTLTLLQVTYPSVMVMVTRLDNAAMLPLDMMTNAAIAGLKSTMPMTITAQEKIQVDGAIGASDFMGTLKLDGLDAPFRIRIIAQSKNIWMLMSMANPSETVSDAALKSYLTGFVLPKP